MRLIQLVKVMEMETGLYKNSGLKRRLRPNDLWQAFSRIEIEWRQLHLKRHSMFPTNNLEITRNSPSYHKLQLTGEYWGEMISQGSPSGVKDLDPLVFEDIVVLRRSFQKTWDQKMGIVSSSLATKRRPQQQRQARRWAWSRCLGGREQGDQDLTKNELVKV